MSIGIIRDKQYIMHLKGIVDVDPETGIRHYIDPISMIVKSKRE
jgi:hypothetical protein